jgi:trans-2-enoyl-CoA reductase
LLAVHPAVVILIRMISAPITPSDLSQIAGFGGKSASYPRTGGNEGLGVVVEVGADAKGVTKGQYVLANTAGQGTWSTHVIGDADAWTVLPDNAAADLGKAALPFEIAAVSVAAPLLAKSLLQDFAGLGSGDVLVQNNAFSTVGQAVIQYAAQKGIKTVNVLRKTNEWGNAVHHLQGLGASLVVDEEYAASAAFRNTMADLPAPKLGLNSVGGAASKAVGNALGPKATLVTYGAMSGKPVSAPLDWFASKQMSLVGANLDAKLRAMSKKDRDVAVLGALEDVAGGDKARVRLLVAREPFLDFPSALARSLARSERKVVLNFPSA